MTKLSDALRGAADRAPVGDVGISSDVAARRVARQRGLRGAANGLVGVGAVTVLALGVMSPGLGLFNGNDSGSESAADMAGPMSGQGSDGVEREAFSDMAFCGYPAGNETAWGEPTVEYTAELPDGLENVGGDSIDVEITVTALSDTELTTYGPQIMVAWEGLVVGHVLSGGQDNAFTLAAGESVTSQETVALVNCWDGAPLPGGEYELLVSQMFTSQEADVIIPVEPGDDEPIVEIPTPQSDAADGDQSVTDMQRDIAVAPTEFYVVASPVTLVVDGDVPEDPFADYLYGMPGQIELPDNYLTPEIARALYNDSVQTGTWNMAAGTQRWVMQNGADQQYDDAAWERNYYGCSWDGTVGNTFPAQSADMGLLSIEASLPSLLSLSYGWVVNDNPVYSMSVTNTSEYSIPGFYGQPSSQLYLVENGRIVAEAYGVNTDRNAEFGIWEDGAEYNAMQHLGLLEPGANLDGQFLWRDLNGCWTETGGPALVNPGTYTVLTAQYVHVSSGDEYMYWGYDDMPVEEGFSMEGSEPRDMPSPAASDMAIMPAPGGDYDWVELVVWTSLGTVTVTN